MIRSRYLDLVTRTAFRHGKMAFVTGPRQVGKTTLARQFLAGGPGLYYTWDDADFKRAWSQDPKALVPQNVGPPQIVVFDELHRAPRWKAGLKSVFDLRGEFARILVTGSARLDVFRRGGESLLGRYFPFRLHPLSMGELAGGPAPGPDDLAAALKAPLKGDPEGLKHMSNWGGFPEPFLARDAGFSNLWRRTRTERLVREDLRDVGIAHDLPSLETAAFLLAERVGSLFSLQSLARDLGVAHPTIRRWMTWFSQLYLTFLLPPWSRRIVRSLRRQPKLYLWEWSEVPSPPARFENLVASHLLKAAHFWTDAGLGSFELTYVRDKQKREVDFLLVRDRQPWLLAEVKLGDTSPAPHLRTFAAALRPRLVLQIVGATGVQELFDLDGGEKGLIVSADAFLLLLP